MKTFVNALVLVSLAMRRAFFYVADRRIIISVFTVPVLQAALIYVGFIHR